MTIKRFQASDGYRALFGSYRPSWLPPEIRIKEKIQDFEMEQIRRNYPNEGRPNIQIIRIEEGFTGNGDVALVTYRSSVFGPNTVELWDDGEIEQFS